MTFFWVWFCSEDIDWCYKYSCSEGFESSSGFVFFYCSTDRENMSLYISVHQKMLDQLSIADKTRLKISSKILRFYVNQALSFPNLI